MSEFKHNSFYTASNAAWAVAHDKKEGDENVAYYLGLILDFIRDLEFDYVPNGVTVKELKMTSWKQIAFPDDMVDYSKVGIRCGNLIKVFVQDPNIPKLFDTDEDCVPQPQKDCEHINKVLPLDAVIYFHSDYAYSGFNHGQYYGRPVDDNGLGYFSIDYKKRVINFRDTVDRDQTVYLEYITDGINYSGDTVINPYCFELAKIYAKWQTIENNDEAPLRLKQRWENNYNKEFMKVEERLVPIDTDDILDALRHGFTMVPQN